MEPKECGELEPSETKEEPGDLEEPEELAELGESDVNHVRLSGSVRRDGGPEE